MSNSIQRALCALADGGMVVVADAADRENEGDLIMAAEHMTPGSMAFFMRHGSGIVCTPMAAGRADALGLGLMVENNTDSHGTAFTVTVDHASVGTGISAHDRAATVRALADPATLPADLRRPGHVFPLRARDGGVLTRAGHTEAATDLLRLAGCSGVGVITELVGTGGVPLSGEQPSAFARRHGLPHLDIAELVQHRRRTEPLVEPTGDAHLPTSAGTFHAWSFRSRLDGLEHLALTMGDLAAADARPEGVLVRVHSECLTGDVMGSLRCDCGTQLRRALELIASDGAGVLVYLRGHEGRGIGLGRKLQAYALQEAGRDTVDANLDLGLPVDDREYRAAAAILARLGVHRVRLITNNPHKRDELTDAGLQLLGRVALPPELTTDNIRYLRTKRDRLGHQIDLPALVADA
ncbi:3,4-dihydroxy-2-butanone-4-phosphate synthase [Pseudonocardia acidicola]